MGLISKEVIALKEQTMTESNCLLLSFWRDVAERIGPKEAGKMLAARMAEGPLEWVKNKPEFFTYSLDLHSNDALAAFALKREWFGQAIYPLPLKYKVLSHSPKEVRWLEASFCPMYAAGSILGLDMNVICSEAKGGFLDTAMTMFLREAFKNPKMYFENSKVRQDIDGACELTLRVME